MSTLVYLAVAAVFGMAAATGMRRVPYAGAGCALAALIVAVTVSLPLNDLGPTILDVALLPAAAGALAGALACRALLARLARA